ncbi:unnamed protein product [Caenorhabditis bovis]|uniref:Anamorsin homolog n=1 Tax=Caenorhabditis bovis TaxID=2654633 RepID=A0A8S1ET55_9PELO|nr:unnamed protein product [Caenorhabditis bovis]
MCDKLNWTVDQEVLVLVQDKVADSKFTYAIIEASDATVLEKLTAFAFDILQPNSEAIVYFNDAAVASRKSRIAGFIVENGELPVIAKKTSSMGEKFTLKLPQAVDEDELIDEDALLEDDDFKKPTEAELKAGCNSEEGKKKRACKNCTCGLAEQEQNEKIANIASAPKSSCGNCALGDAFRCATCPYLGQPPFKPGETVKLANVDDF